MQEPEKYLSEQRQAELAGKSEFERSENSLLPAAPPEGREPGGGQPKPGSQSGGEDQHGGPGAVEGAKPSVAREAASIFHSAEYSALPSGELRVDNSAGSVRAAAAKEDGEEAQPAATPEDAAGGAERLPKSLAWAEDFPERSELPAVGKTRHRGTYGKAVARAQVPLTPQQRLLLLDTWQRSGLPARDFAALVNVSRHTLYAWKRRFEQQGPAGLMDQPRGSKKGSRLPELTKRTILMLKQAHPEWGCQRISDMLVRGPALPASAGAVARVLREAGYESADVPTRPHADHVRRFERAAPNQLWQTDLFTFVLKRQNRRVYLVAFMDDHSRFVTGYGLHGSQSTALVIEVLRAAIAGYGVPGEILTDNGTQYVTWRGKSQFTRELEKLGVRQIVARPKRPQTLGKIERFWGTLWRECVERAVFIDLEDARRRIGLFIDYYNFQRVHAGIEGLVPADRFFHASPAILETLKQRVAAQALELARHGVPKSPFYLTGQVEGKPFSVHRAGDRVILQQAGQPPEEIDLVPPPPPPQTSAKAPELPPPVCPQGVPEGTNLLPTEQPPGTSALDAYLATEQPPKSPEKEEDAS